MPTKEISKFEDAGMVQTIKDTVCKGASDSQLKMFIEVCKSTGLNPFLKEIWYVAEKGIIMAARDGYLRVANENPNFDGIETRVERDQNKVPIKAVCTVWRKDRNHPVICEAFYNEYAKPSPVWKQYPSAMIGKVAEVLALKRSFAINGVVSEEEVGHDGAGSASAARELAETKIEAMKAAKANGQSVVEVIVEPAPLHEAIVENPVKVKSRKEYDHFAMLKAVKSVKDRFLKLGAEPIYRQVLRSYGVEKSNMLPKDDGGVAARACYKELSLTVANLEAQAAKREEIPEVAKLPDPVEQVIGTEMRCDSEIYAVVDSEEGYKWEIQ